MAVGWRTVFEQPTPARIRAGVEITVHTVISRRTRTDRPSSATWDGRMESRHTGPPSNGLPE